MSPLKINTRSAVKKMVCKSFELAGCLLLALTMLCGANLSQQLVAQQTEQEMTVANFLRLDSTDAYQLLSDGSLDLRATAVGNAVTQLDRMLQVDHNRLRSAAVAVSAEKPSGDQLGSRSVRFDGRLQRVWEITADSDSMATVDSPEAALEAAMKLSAQQTPLFVCQISCQGLDDTVAFLTPAVPEWIKKRLATTKSFDFESVPVNVAGCGISLAAKELQFDQNRMANVRTVIGKRLEWYPGSQQEIKFALTTLNEQADSESTGDELVLRSWLRLSKARFDVGLLDRLMISQRAPLLASDSEPFYQLLSRADSLLDIDGDQNGVGANHEGQQDDGTGTWPPLSVKRAIVEPRALVGTQVSVSAVVKQITRVPLTADERGPQLGVQEYFLLHGLVQLPKPIRLKISEGEHLNYDRQFPIVIAARALPAGWEAGEDMRRWVDAKCVFVKSWTYKSAKTRQLSVDQWSPLLVAIDLQPGQPPADKTVDWPIGWLLLIPVGLAMLGLLVSSITGFRR